MKEKIASNCKFIGAITHKVILFWKSDVDRLKAKELVRLSVLVILFALLGLWLRPDNEGFFEKICRRYSIYSSMAFLLCAWVRNILQRKSGKKFAYTLRLILMICAVFLAPWILILFIFAKLVGLNAELINESDCVEVAYMWGSEWLICVSANLITLFVFFRWLIDCAREMQKIFMLSDTLSIFLLISSMILVFVLLDVVVVASYNRIDLRNVENDLERERCEKRRKSVVLNVRRALYKTYLLILVMTYALIAFFMNVGEAQTLYLNVITFIALLMLYWDKRNEWKTMLKFDEKSINDTKLY